MNRSRLGEILVAAHGADSSDIDAALAIQQEKGGRIGEILCRNFSLSPQNLARALAEQFGLPYTEQIADVDGDEELLAQIPIAYARRNRLFPLELNDNEIRVVIADPLNISVSNDLAVIFSRPVALAVTSDEEIERAINRHYEQHSQQANDLVDDIGNDLDQVGLVPEDLIDTSDEAPIIRFVNSLLTQAYKQRASDIHIEPSESELYVRLRVDGVLQEALRPPLSAHAPIVSRIKIMSQLDIAEKRLPQDGRFGVRIAGRDIDIRVSVLPTALGERVVLRLLDRTGQLLNLEQLGLADDALRQVKGMIGKSHGVFLVTGPTGSGKTTTLYAALMRLNDREKNIITVEDPVEYRLQGVGQIQVNPRINLTFAAGLRSILRQDPDIIMVGEIRDGETAGIAIQSAMTGHLVFSTLHTNDAATALTRLVEMGVEPFLAASSVVGILAQRLVRRVCLDCSETHRPDPAFLKETGLDELVPAEAELVRGKGCDTCHGSGYRGRLGIFELLSMSDAIREKLLANSDAPAIRQQAIGEGMIPLRDFGVARALAGETTLEEVLRVTQEDE